MNLRKTAIALILIGALSSPGQRPSTAAPDLTRLQRALLLSMEFGAEDAVGVARGLTDAQRMELIRIFAGQLRSSMKELGAGSEADLRRIAATDTRIKLVDLDGDGIAEVAVHGSGSTWGCSPTGNCPFWILKKTANGYRTIIDTTAQTFSMEDKHTNGFPDLLLSMHGSVSSSELRVYRYEAGRYHRYACYEARSTAKIGEENRDLKMPLLTKSNC